MQVKKRTAIKILGVLCSIFFIVSAFVLIEYGINSRESNQNFEQMAQLVADDAQGMSPHSADNTPQAQLTAHEKYKELHDTNPDFVGWIEIEGTKLDYPVMQTLDSPDYYLKRDFNGEYSDYGVPYIDEKCTPDVSSNIIIYGHSMTDGSMFRALLNYEEAGYYLEHSTINFDTMSGYGEYEIIAAFKIDVDIGEFFYTDYTDMDEVKFAQYMEQIKSYALYETGVTAQYGDKLLTLSTCEYTLEDGRFVVVAKKI